jgi:hypothetical protein
LDKIPFRKEGLKRMRPWNLVRKDWFQENLVARENCFEDGCGVESVAVFEFALKDRGPILAGVSEMAVVYCEDHLPQGYDFQRTGLGAGLAVELGQKTSSYKPVVCGIAVCSVAIFGFGSKPHVVVAFAFPCRLASNFVPYIKSCCKVPRP